MEGIEQKLRGLWFILLTAFICHSHGQGGIATPSTPHADSLKAKQAQKVDPETRKVSEFFLGIDSFYKWDSTFNMVQRYNRLQRNALPYVDLGVNGSPAQLLIFNPFINPGYQTGFSHFPLQNKDPEKMIFYRAKVPFTAFEYLQGTKFIMFNARHTQNISKTWNIAIDFSNIQNDELYVASGQTNMHRGTMLGSFFQNKKGNYSNVIIASWNRCRRTENFGIAAGYDTLFFVPTKNKIRSAPEYLVANKTTNSVYGTYHHLLYQKLFLNAEKSVYIFQRSDWKKERYTFIETARKPNDKIYGSKPVLNDTTFKDSVAWTQWNNEIGIGNNLKRNAIFPLLWKFSISANSFAYNSIYKTASNTDFNQALHAYLNWNPYLKSKLFLDFNADYYFGGLNKTDYNLQARAGYVSNGATVYAGIHTQAYAAPAYMQQFVCNYKRYTNNLTQVKANSIFANFQFNNDWLNVNLNAETGNCDAFIYADTAANFKQTNGVLFANITGSLTIRWGKLYIQNKFTFQSQNKQNIIPMPKYSDLFSLYFQGHVFKKVMLARIGMDVWLTGAYNGYIYHPELAVFSPTSVTAGNYPQVDFYISGELKTVQLFLKAEHSNQMLTNYGFNNRYYAAIGYPIEPFRLQLGLNWKFYN
jgi:hypothetical protein